MPSSRDLDKVPCEIKSETREFKTPDQASAMYIRGANLSVNVKDADWESLMIATDILGGGSLDSRLAKYVREEKGLSYQVGCNFTAGELNRAGVFMTFATTNPKNKSALLESIEMAFEKVREKGFTEEELKSAKTTYLKAVESSLSNDGQLCDLINRYEMRGVGLDFLTARMDRIRNLSLEEVNAAARKLLAAQSVTVVAGDFPGSAK